MKNFVEKFDGIITDIPYTKAIKGKLNEQNFNLKDFLEKTDLDTIENAFLITFSNFLNFKDLVILSEKTNWKFHTFQIWNKEPYRTWISWQHPIRTTEFIIYFKKGNFKFNFKNGIIKDKVNRNSFGGSLKKYIKKYK